MATWISAVVAVTAAVITVMLGFLVIPMLRRLKFGQTILDIGPIWHKEKKEGIPTMGGIMFIVGTIIAFIVGMIMLWQNGVITFDSVGNLRFLQAVYGIIMAVMFGFVGFLDDFLKVRRKKNEGLTPNQKIIFQVLIIAAYFTSRIMAGDTDTTINFPFIGTLDLWYFYYVIMGLGIIYMVNAVNLTDGIDGLCSSVSVVYFAAFMVICNILGFSELSVLSVAAAGGCLGFLVWNFHPAKVFMGDTGSMFLGGVVCALGLGTHCEVLMVLAGAVYVWEALSVVIQVTYYKITKGKRLFKMTPIHHSFEKSGWKEPKIVLLFSALTVVGGTIAVLLTAGM